MEKTADSVAAEVAALRQSLSEVSAAVDRYAELATQNVGNKDVTASGDVSQSHRDLYLKSRRLLQTVRGPVDMVISNFEQVRTWELKLVRFKSLIMSPSQCTQDACEQ